MLWGPAYSEKETLFGEALSGVHTTTTLSYLLIYMYHLH